MYYFRTSILPRFQVCRRFFRGILPTISFKIFCNIPTSIWNWIFYPEWSSCSTSCAQNYLVNSKKKLEKNNIFLFYCYQSKIWPVLTQHWTKSIGYKQLTMFRLNIQFITEEIIIKQQYHVVQLSASWVGRDLGLGQWASWAVHGWQHGLVHDMAHGDVLLGDS